MNKKTFIAKSLVACMALGIVFTGCKKDEDETPTPNIPTKPTPVTPKKPTPTFEGATGVWVALIYSTLPPAPAPQIPIEFSMGTGGMFRTDGSYKDCGVVKLDGYTLTKQSNSTYLWTNTTGSSAGNIWSTSNMDADWSIAGSAADTVPPITNSTVNGFPVVAEVISSSTISKSAGHSVKLGAGSNALAISNADSVIIVLSVGNKSKTWVYAVNSTGGNNFDIPAAELSGFANGTGVLQVAAYNMQVFTVGFDLLYFVNEKLVSQSVKLQ